MITKSIGISILVIIISTMNLWFKYGPLAYTFFTRCWVGKHKILNSIYFLFVYVGIWTIPLLVVFIQGKTTFIGLTLSVLLYIYVFFNFLIFYEIGYLCNDLVVNKEKTGTIRIKEKVSNNYYRWQILIRLVVGCILLIPLGFINTQLLHYFIIIIILMLIVFLFHNLIRNYFYNFFTIFFLRFCKFILFILPLYYLIGTLNTNIIYEEIVVFLLYHHLITIDSYDSRLGGKRGLPQGLVQYGYLIVATGILYIFNHSLIYLFYLILYFLLFIIMTPREYFKFENNR